MRRHDDLDSGGMHEPRKRRGEIPTGWIVAGVVALLFLLFALQNSERVDVDLIVFDAQVRVVVLILVSALLGFAVGWLLARPSRAERRQRRKE